MRKPDHTIVFGSPVDPPPPTSVRMRPLSEDLIDETSFMQRPERGLVFAAVSLAMIGVVAAGTYFFVGSREPSTFSTTNTTSAEVAKPAEPAAAHVITPTDLPWDKPEVDAVRAPGTPQVVPAERAPVVTQAPAAPVVAKPAMKVPPPGMSDEALERAGLPDPPNVPIQE